MYLHLIADGVINIAYRHHTLSKIMLNLSIILYLFQKQYILVPTEGEFYVLSS